MTYKSFEDLDIWNLSREFCINIYKIASSFPKEEKFRLADQIIRSSRSVLSNIAEGYGRFHYQENIQFCRQARGSLMETKNHLVCALDCNYISSEVFMKYDESYYVILKKLNAYISYLKQLKEGHSTKTTSNSKSTN